MKVFECEKCGSVARSSDRELPPRCYEHGPMREVITVPVGSREWAWAVVNRGDSVWNDRLGLRPEAATRGAGCLMIDYNPALTTGWYILPSAPPPWVPHRGDRVRWYRGEDSGTGTFQFTDMDSGLGPHIVTVGGRSLYVSRVEPPEVKP